MRDAQADALADPRRVGGVAASQRRWACWSFRRDDLPARRHARAAPVAPRAARAIGIGISMSNDRSRRPAASIARPGSGQDCTCVQTSSAGRSALAVRAAQARFDDADEALVVAVVVRDVAARAQQAAHRAAQRRRQARGHEVEDGRAAGRQQHLVGVEQALRVAGARDRVDAVHQRRGVGRVGVGAALGAQAFVALDADEARPRGSRAGAAPARSASSCVRQPVRPPGRPSSSSTSNGTLPAWRADQASISASCAGESTRKATRRPACSRSSCWIAARSASPSTWLAISARRTPAAHADRELRDGGEGDAPGAGIELAREQLRRHRGLAVRRQVDAPVPRLALHPGDVVRERVALEQRDRQRQVAGQHVPAGLRDGAAAQRGLVVREALEAGADERVEQVVGVHGECRDQQVLADVLP